MGKQKGGGACYLDSPSYRERLMHDTRRGEKVQWMERMHNHLHHIVVIVTKHHLHYFMYVQYSIDGEYGDGEGDLARGLVLVVVVVVVVMMTVMVMMMNSDGDDDDDCGDDE